MKLIPHCRRVKIRIESGGYSCASLEALKKNFYVEDIIPLVRDGRLQRWLEDLEEDELAQTVAKISANATDENEKQMTQELLYTFLPQYFNEKSGILESALQLYGSYNYGALYEILYIFKGDISKDVILEYWNELAECFTFKELGEIVSPYRNTDKDIAYNWACLYQKKMNLTYSDAMEVAAMLGHDKAMALQRLRFETDRFAWRDFVKVENNCPTTGKELEVLFTIIYPNGGTFCKFKPLENFYIDVWHIYNILKSPGLISNARYDAMMKIFNGENLDEDPLRIERLFISKLLLWHKYAIEYPYRECTYRESDSLFKEKARPAQYKGDINLELKVGNFLSFTLWKQILYVTLNIFNKQLYPDWK